MLDKEVEGNMNRSSFVLVISIEKVKPFGPLIVVDSLEKRINLKNTLGTLGRES